MPVIVFYWIGAAVAIGGAFLLLAGLLYLAGWLLLRANDFFLKQTMRTIRLANWRYWNHRMMDEGLIVMPRFYAELVGKRKPKTVGEWSAVDLESERMDVAETNTAPRGAVPCDLDTVQ